MQINLLIFLSLCLLRNLGAPYSRKEMEQIRNWREVKNYVIGLAGPTFRISHKGKKNTGLEIM